MDYKVSIIVPVYNVEKYIKRCLDSIINQTYKNIEIIIINDGSTDKSIEIINEYYAQNENIFIYNKNNGGLSSARNLGIEKAKGQYLLFVDSDDWIELNCIDYLIKVIENEKSDIVEFAYRMVNDDKEFGKIELTNQNIKTREKILEEFFYGTQITDIICNKIYKRDLFLNKRFIEEKIHEDYMIMPELLYECDKITIISNIFYNYYQRDNSITQQKFTEKNFDRFFAGRHVAKFCNEFIPQFYEIALVRIGFICIYLYNHLIVSAKFMNKDEYKDYKKRIISEFNDIYKKVHNSNCLKKLPGYKKIMLKMFWYNKSLTVRIYRLLRG